MILTAVLAAACDSLPSEAPGYTERSREFDEYWMDGQAEVNIYRLEQGHHGEVYPGRATVIFTVPYYSDSDMGETDMPDRDDRKVMKCNWQRQFFTGIYPNSLMSTVFSPVNFPEEHAYKVSSSLQNWHGHAYTFLLNEDQYLLEMTSHNSFSEEPEKRDELSANWMEDEFWNEIRLNPELLPTGEVTVIPALHYNHLTLEPIDSYLAQASTKDLGDGKMEFHLEYAHLDREVRWIFDSAFPHVIRDWYETHTAVENGNEVKMTTHGSLESTSKTEYRKLNHLADSVWRRNFELKE